MSRQTPGYWIGLLMTGLFTLAAVSSLIPDSGAGKACLLGYKAHCSFTPVSTILCLILAGSACFVRRRIIKTR